MTEPSSGITVQWAVKPEPAALEALVDAMDAARGILTPERAAAPSESTGAATGPGPQTRLAREAMATMKGVRAIQDQEARAKQIADAIEAMTAGGSV